MPKFDKESLVTRLILCGRGIERNDNLNDILTNIEDLEKSLKYFKKELRQDLDKI